MQRGCYGTSGRGQGLPYVLYLLYLVGLSYLGSLGWRRVRRARGARSVGPIANFLEVSAPDLAGADGLHAVEGEVLDIVQLVYDFAVRSANFPNLLNAQWLIGAVGVKDSNRFGELPPQNCEVVVHGVLEQIGRERPSTFDPYHCQVPAARRRQVDSREDSGSVPNGTACQGRA